MGFVIYVAIKMIVNNFAAYCCSHYIYIGKIVMSFEIKT